MTEALLRFPFRVEPVPFAAVKVPLLSDAELDALPFGVSCLRDGSSRALHQAWRKVAPKAWRGFSREWGWRLFVVAAAKRAPAVEQALAAGADSLPAAVEALRARV